MKLSLFFDHRFYRQPDGTIYSPAAYNYELLAKRYLAVFSELTVIARVADAPSGMHANERHAEGNNVRVVSVGNWWGPLGYFRGMAGVQRIISAELAKDSAVLMIAPGRIGQVAHHLLRNSARPYGVEVVGDPQDVYAPGASRHPMRPILQRWATRQLRLQCSQASTVSFVNETILPKRYPPGNRAFVTSYSSIELLDAHFSDRRVADFTDNVPFTIITVGSLATPYKGVDNLLSAIHLLGPEYENVRLKVVGDGKFRAELQDQARRLGLDHRVTFLGHLPAGDRIRQELDSADLFVLASRTEGLPRAMIEAMARGLPCIGTAVGGVPELLPPEVIVERDAPAALARTMAGVFRDVERRQEMSNRNRASARRYETSVLRQRRIEHYEQLKDRTERWLQSQRR